MKQLFFSLLAITAITLGCKKERIDNTQNASDPEVVLKNNTSNPYEYIGQQHNLSLGYMLSINSTDYNVAVSHVAQSLNEPQSRFAEWSTLESGLNAAVADGQGEFNNMTADPNVGSYLTSLKSILLASNSSTIEANTSNLVASILSPNNGLSDENRAVLLGTTAVAKHSFLFWSSYQGGISLKTVWNDIVGFYQGFRLEWDNNLGLDGFAQKLEDSLLSGLGGAVYASSN